jgi:hypothetical protein
MTTQTMTLEWHTAPIGTTPAGGTSAALAPAERAELEYLRREVHTLKAELVEARQVAADLQLELEHERVTRPTSSTGHPLPADMAAAVIEQLQRELTIEQQQTNYWYLKATHTDEEVRAMQERRRASLATYLDWLTPAEHAAYTAIDGTDTLTPLPRISTAA